MNKSKEWRPCHNIMKLQSSSWCTSTLSINISFENHHDSAGSLRGGLHNWMVSSSSSLISIFDIFSMFFFVDMSRASYDVSTRTALAIERRLLTLRFQNSPWDFLFIYLFFSFFFFSFLACFLVCCVRCSFPPPFLMTIYNDLRKERWIIQFRKDRFGCLDNKWQEILAPAKGKYEKRLGNWKMADESESVLLISITSSISSRVH